MLAPIWRCGSKTRPPADHTTTCAMAGASLAGRLPQSQRPWRDGFGRRWSPASQPPASQPASGRSSCAPRRRWAAPTPKSRTRQRHQETTHLCRTRLHLLHGRTRPTLLRRKQRREVYVVLCYLPPPGARDRARPKDHPAPWTSSNAWIHRPCNRPLPSCRPLSNEQPAGAWAPTVSSATPSQDSRPRRQEGAPGAFFVTGGQTVDSWQKRPKPVGKPWSALSQSSPTTTGNTGLFGTRPGRGCRKSARKAALTSLSGVVGKVTNTKRLGGKQKPPCTPNAACWRQTLSSSASA